MLAFHAEERRDAMLTYVIDLYAGDLRRPSGRRVAGRGLSRPVGLLRAGAAGPGRPRHPKERQLDFLRRVALAVRGARARRTGARSTGSRCSAPSRGCGCGPITRFDDEEYNTYACPWHHNLTAAIVSFRTAKALKRNPGSTFDITELPLAQLDAVRMAFAPAARSGADGAGPVVLRYRTAGSCRPRKVEAVPATKSVSQGASLAR